MNTRELILVAREFREGMIGKGSAESMCYMICAPLAGYLHFLGEQAEVIHGSVAGTEHYWIRLASGLILDPTACQFTTVDRPMPEIYLGTKPRWYREKKQKERKGR
jgi:hypothetical protein